MSYPAKFIWGAGLSAHQTEGSFGGGEGCDWYAFEHSKNAEGKSPIEGGDTADLASDFWHRYNEDFELAKNIGLNSVRISVAWEKIEPARGVFSAAATEHYRQMLSAMRERGLRPLITLHHFTNPLWFMDLGGWLSPESPHLFLEYATHVVEQLGDLCDLWITLNEPMVFVSMSYLQKLTPPQAGSLDAAFEATFNLARAHRMVTAMIHERQGKQPEARGPEGELRGVSIANAFSIYDPFNPAEAKDRFVAETLAELGNWTFLRTILGDRLKVEIPSEIPGAKNFERIFPENDLPPGADPRLDWLGINYYMRYLMQYRSDYRVRAEWHTPAGPLTDNGWSIYPEGLERILKQAAEVLPGLPLVVSENGLSDASDQKRMVYIRDVLAALDRVLPQVDLRGYYHWSLTDNFEWLAGYKQRFGLVEIRYDENRRRVPRPSSEVYRAEISKRLTHPV